MPRKYMDPDNIVWEEDNSIHVDTKRLLAKFNVPYTKDNVAMAIEMLVQGRWQGARHRLLAAVSDWDAAY